MSLLSPLLPLLSLASALASADDLLVETSLGPVLGSLRSTSRGRAYHSFQGDPVLSPWYKLVLTSAN